MFNLLNKGSLSALLALLCVTTSSVSAWEQPYDTYEYSDCECNSNRFYIGGFGGGIYSDSTKISQMGTAFFAEDLGGPLAVYAKGHTRSSSAGFGGFQIGYEWSNFNALDSLPFNDGCCSNWSFAPALEFEGFFFSHTKCGHLHNPTSRLSEHNFSTSFPMDMSVLIVNGVLALEHTSLFGFTPYVGGGIGTANISIQHARSFQIAPVELGVNHFNSRRSDSSWAFAAQVKAGLRYKICDSLHIFGEYRYVYVDCSDFIFGSTVYPTHVPTSPWNVKVKDINYNAFAFGLQYDL